MVTIPAERTAFTPVGNPVVALTVVAPVTAYVIVVIEEVLQTFCKVVAVAEVSVIAALGFTVVVLLAAVLPVQPAAFV